MMGQSKPPQPPLFYAGFSIDQRMRRDHPLREIAARIDFQFIAREVEHFYGAVGHESVPPPVLLKMMFLLFYYDVPSERELMSTIPERLDWMWFLGYELDSVVPNHSVLSKARNRWGSDAFRRFFERIILQCVEEGLVDGRKVFCDSSLVDANASVKSIVRVPSLSAVSAELEKRLEETASGSPPDEPPRGPGSPSGLVSTTDPDAAVVKTSTSKARARYKSHRAIDDAYGVITATLITAGDVNEGHRLMPLLEQHETTTGSRAEITIGDSAYGTKDNLLACSDRGITAHLAPLSETNNEASLRRRGKLTRRDFIYDASSDRYVCPQGERLTRLQDKPEKNAVQYVAPAKSCQACPIRSLCTESTTRGRALLRHYREDDLNRLIEHTHSVAARSDLRRRHHFMERSFAQATRFGFKRCRWRGQWRAEIQDLIIATIQNIQLLIRKARRRPIAAVTIFSCAIRVRPRIVEYRLLLSCPSPAM